MDRFQKLKFSNHRLQFARRSLVVSLFCLLTVSINSGCENPVACTAEFVFGLGVQVHDAEGEPVCDAIVTITDGDYEEVLEESECGFYSGAGERAGTYDIRVEAAGYLTQNSTGHTVTEDECHVNPESANFTLESDPDYNGGTDSDGGVESDAGEESDAGNDEGANDDAGSDEADAGTDVDAG